MVLLHGAWHWIQGVPIIPHAQCHAGVLEEAERCGDAFLEMSTVFIGIWWYGTSCEVPHSDAKKYEKT